MTARGAAAAAAAMLAGLALAAAVRAQSPGAGAPTELPLDVRSFRVAESQSGPVSYYSLVQSAEGVFIRARYRPPLETVTLGLQLPDQAHRRTTRLRWQWRALALPTGGDECRDGYGDSAAAVYVTWKRGLKWYSLKYVWSSVGKPGQVCDRRRNLFVAQDTIVLRSGGPVGLWRTEDIDPVAEFRAHFGSDVPDLVGLGLMTDGDQTRSMSSADYRNFSILLGR